MAKHAENDSNNHPDHTTVGEGFELDDPHGQPLLDGDEPFFDGNAHSGPTQDKPLMEQDPVTQQQKIDGILVQTAADVGDHPVEAILDALRERFRDANIAISSDELDNYAAQIYNRDEELPQGTYAALRDQGEADN